MKKYLFLPFVLGALILTLAGCSSKQKDSNLDSQNDSKTASAKNIIVPDKVEVYLFHATQRCTTCIAIGKLAGETVAEYFQPELRDGKIEFKEINIDLPENKALAQKFQASGSALFINTIYEGSDHIIEDATVWRLTSNEAQFKSYLQDKLNSLLGK